MIIQKQLQKLAGYAIVESVVRENIRARVTSATEEENASDMYCMKQYILIARNEEFKEVHRYYRTRKKIR